MTTDYPAEVPTMKMVKDAIAQCFPARAEAAQKLLNSAAILLAGGLEADHAEYDRLMRQAWMTTG